MFKGLFRVAVAFVIGKLSFTHQSPFSAQKRKLKKNKSQTILRLTHGDRVHMFRAILRGRFAPWEPIAQLVEQLTFNQ